MNEAKLNYDHLGGIVDPAEVETMVQASIRRAFAAESATRQRDPHYLGISSLSGCTRFAAYAIARTPPSDSPEPREGRSANLGTWEHCGLLPRLAGEFWRGADEVEVTLRASGITIPGRIDLDAPGMILDLKTVGEWKLQAVRRSGPMPAHVMQVAAYALARLQAGHTPQWLVVLYMDRATGECQPFAIPFTNGHVSTVIDRIAEICRWSDNPDTTPRCDASGSAMSGPGYSYSCDECPWLRRCWGPDAQQGQRARKCHDNPEIEALLMEYVEVNAIEGPAKRRKAEIAKLLESVKNGTYGDVKYYRPQDVVVDDPYAALRILKTLGYEVPQRPQRGKLSIRLMTSTKKRKAKGHSDAAQT